MPDLSAIRDYAREQTLVEGDDLPHGKLNNIINQGVREVASRFDWPFLAATETTTLSAGVGTLDLTTLSSSVARIKTVLITDSRYRLSEISPQGAWSAYGDQFGSGRPSRFFWWGSNLYFVPVPAEDTGLTVHFLTSPTELSNDEDEPEWDSRFHLILADYAIWRLWEREEEYAKAQQAQEDFGLGVERMARFYLNRAEDSPLIVGGSRARVRNDRSFLPFD